MVAVVALTEFAVGLTLFVVALLAVVVVQEFAVATALVVSVASLAAVGLVAS